eukprot:RCo027969
MMPQGGYIRDPYSSAGFKDFNSSPVPAITAGQFPTAAFPVPRIQPQGIVAAPHPPAAVVAAAVAAPAAGPAIASFVPLPGVVLPVVVALPPPSSTPQPQPLPSTPNAAVSVLGLEEPASEEPWPCPHNRSWKRLRVKKGLNHFLCTQCGARWKGSHYFLQFLGRGAVGHPVS